MFGLVLITAHACTLPIVAVFKVILASDNTGLFGVHNNKQKQAEEPGK
jgi:hypothetical protein